MADKAALIAKGALRLPNKAAAVVAVPGHGDVLLAKGMRFLGVVHRGAGRVLGRLGGEEDGEPALLGGVVKVQRQLGNGDDPNAGVLGELILRIDLHCRHAKKRRRRRKN